MAKHKIRVMLEKAGGSLFAISIGALALRLSTWANNHHSALTATTITGLIGAGGAAVAWIFTKDEAETVPGNSIPSVSSRTQRARDVSGQMFQAEHLYYTELPNSNESLDIDIEIKEITFNATRTGGQSVFLWVKLLLKNPTKTEAVYSLSIVSHGVPTHPKIVDDLHVWTFREREIIGQYSSHGQYLPALSLPSILEAGTYAEGWLHFVSDEVTDIEVGRSLLRLRLETPFGKKEKEKQGITITGTRYTMRRRIEP